MVHHDFILGRLTRGNSRLDERTAAELKGIEYFATADRMLTLGELCDLVAGRVPMLVEIKSRFDGDVRLARAHRRGACRLSRPGRGDVVRSGADRRAFARPSPEAAARAWSPCGATADSPATATSRRAYLAAAVRRPAAVPRLPGAGPDHAARRALARELASPAAAHLDRPHARATASAAALHADQMIFEGFRP